MSSLDLVEHLTEELGSLYYNHIMSKRLFPDNICPDCRVEPRFVCSTGSVKTFCSKCAAKRDMARRADPAVRAAHLATQHRYLARKQEEYEQSVVELREAREKRVKELNGGV